ncbi:MAG: hypothetical protein AAF985_13660 [Bacteroidota bacterium]
MFAISAQYTEWLTNTDGDGKQSDIHPYSAGGVNAVAHGVSSKIADEFDISSVSPGRYILKVQNLENNSIKTVNISIVR